MTIKLYKAMKTIEEELQSFIDNEDIDKGNENLRARITSLKELRYALAIASQKYPQEYDDILDALISLD